MDAESSEEYSDNVDEYFAAAAKETADRSKRMAANTTAKERDWKCKIEDEAGGVAEDETDDGADDSHGLSSDETTKSWKCFSVFQSRSNKPKKPTKSSSRCYWRTVRGGKKLKSDGAEILSRLPFRPQAVLLYRS